MEKFRKHFSIKKSVGIWVWLGRVAPLTALMILCIVLAFDFTSWVSYLVSAIALLFAITAFTWWWWVIYAVKHLTEMLAKSREDFGTILTEIVDLKKEISKSRRNKIVQDSDNIIPFEKELNYRKDED